MNYAENQAYPATENARIQDPVTYGGVNTLTPPNENQARHIEIDQLNGGYIIRVGCHSFAFETNTKMLKHLTAYLLNPKETEEKWFKKKLDLTK